MSPTISPIVLTEAWSNCSTTSATAIQAMPTTSHSHQNSEASKLVPPPPTTPTSFSGVMEILLMRALSRRAAAATNRPTRLPGWGVHPRSGAGVLGEVDQRRLHAAADVDGVAEAELEEDCVDVLLDGAFGEHQLVGDRLVAVPAGDEREDLQLA